MRRVKTVRAVQIRPLCIGLLLWTRRTCAIRRRGQHPSRGSGYQGTAATASPNMMMASRNMTAVVMRKLTIGRLLVQQGSPCTTRKQALGCIVLLDNPLKSPSSALPFRRLVLKEAGGGPVAHPPSTDRAAAPHGEHVSRGDGTSSRWGRLPRRTRSRDRAAQAHGTWQWRSDGQARADGRAPSRIVAQLAREAVGTMGNRLVKGGGIDQAAGKQRPISRHAFFSSLGRRPSERIFIRCS